MVDPRKSYEKPRISETPRAFPQKEVRGALEETERKIEELGKEIVQEEESLIPTSVPAATPVPVTRLPKTAFRRTIEKILSEDLAEIYRGMDENSKRMFRDRGKEVASTLEVLVQTAKATAKKIIDLIQSWLKLIPGVNRYFLEQETKIKTDKILALTERRKED